MSGYYGEWRPYVSVGQRRAQARREMAKLRKKGQDIQPVEIEGSTIARSFWGKGWCSHLESFGDYSNRLPRGRTYARNGSVCHLGIEKGVVEAIVSGSELYHVSVEITPLNKSKWNTLKKRCAGQIGSLIELLQGRLSEEIMGTVIDRDKGLFPRPGEIKFSCDCPDWAGMCKHIAAVMYCIGARLDKRPELLFLLRGVDHEELISAGAVAKTILGSGSRRSRRRTLPGKLLEEVFEVELDDAPKKPARTRKVAKDKAAKANPATGKTANGRTTKGKVVKGKAAGTKGTTGRTRMAKRSGKITSKGKSSGAKSPVGATRSPRPFKPTANAVTRLRRRHGMSKAEFARAIGVSLPTISNWEQASGAIKPQAKGLTGLIRLHAQ